MVYAGSHENAVIARGQGTCDAAFNWWNDEQESNLLRMERKGMAKADDFRIIFKSEQIVNSPMAYLTDAAGRPEGGDQDGGARARRPRTRRRSTRSTKASSCRSSAVDHKAYEPVVELIKFVDELRKKKS